jgi:mannitol/fructose-specific phosphotransferase system IIA component (Ntr-type)
MEVKLSDYMNINRIHFCSALSKEEVIDELIDLAREDGKIRNVKGFKEALLKRESIMSTGIGYGVAIPHVKLPDIPDFFITIGLHKRGVNWDSLDCKPVFIILLIAGPDCEQEKYLHILAKLTTIIKIPTQRERLIGLKNKYDVLRMLSGF